MVDNADHTVSVTCTGYVDGKTGFIGGYTTKLNNGDKSPITVRQKFAHDSVTEELGAVASNLLGSFGQKVSHGKSIGMHSVSREIFRRFCNVVAYKKAQALASIAASRGLENVVEFVQRNLVV